MRVIPSYDALAVAADHCQYYGIGVVNQIYFQAVDAMVVQLSKHGTWRVALLFKRPEVYGGWDSICAFKTGYFDYDRIGAWLKQRTCPDTVAQWHEHCRLKPFKAV